MDYDVYEQMRDGKYARMENESSQAHMERVFEAVCSSEVQDSSQRLNDMLKAEFAGCDANEKTLTMVFKAWDWMSNPGGTLHGGMIATSMDMTLGMLARFYKETRKTVTMQLDIRYMRTIEIGDTFRVCAKAEKAGRNVVFLSAKVFAGDERKLAADASAIFI